MRKWRSSAAYRIAFASFGAFAVGVAVLAAVTFSVMRVAFSRQLDSMVSDEVLEIAAEYRIAGAGVLAGSIAQRESSTSSTRMLYAVFAPDGRRIAGSLQTHRPGLGVHELQFLDPHEGPDTARAAVADLSPHARLVVAVDSDWVEQSEETVFLVFGIGFLGTCLIGLGGAILIGRYLEQRLQLISQSAEIIISGDIRQRMPVSDRGDEFDRLAMTLNRMLDRIENLLDNLRQVSSDLAHDLRTPLTRLRNSLELGFSERRAGKVAAAVIENAILRIDEVLSLFAAILRIAEVESGETRRNFGPIDLSVLVEELADSYSAAIHDRGRVLTWLVEPGLAVTGDRELLSQAAINLLENAQQHTPPGTALRIEAASATGQVQLRVIDSGPGVPAADLDRITKRFARLDVSRSTSGYGLGLSLVSAIAKLHGGRLVLNNREPGLSATIEMPALDDSYLLQHVAPMRSRSRESTTGRK
jgi:signal transduction histidine kinase